MKRYMIVATVVWLLVGTVTLVIFFGLGIVLTTENNKYQQALNTFKGMSEEIVLSQQIKYRIKVLGQVLKSRFEYSTALEKVDSIFSEKAKLSKFEIDKDKNFKIMVTAFGREGVNYVEDKVLDVNNGKVEGIKSITINSVSFTVNNGGWDINMEVKLK